MFTLLALFLESPGPIFARIDHPLAVTFHELESRRLSLRETFKASFEANETVVRVESSKRLIAFLTYGPDSKWIIRVFDRKGHSKGRAEGTKQVDFQFGDSQSMDVWTDGRLVSNAKRGLIVKRAERPLRTGSGENLRSLNSQLVQFLLTAQRTESTGDFGLRGDLKQGNSTGLDLGSSQLLVARYDERSSRNCYSLVDLGRKVVIQTFEAAYPSKLFTQGKYYIFASVVEPGSVTVCNPDGSIAKTLDAVFVG